MFLSFIAGLRAARRIGAAERQEKSGGLQGALTLSAEALEILGSSAVDLETPVCRAGASVALWSYCRVARKLELEEELRETLTRWRPRYLDWMKSPATAEERTYLQWFEDLLVHLQKDPGSERH